MRWKAGQLYRIELGVEGCAYALTLESPEVAIMDCFLPEASPDQVLESGPLWRIWVMASALKEASWSRIAQLNSLPQELRASVPRFKKDPISGAYYLYQDEVETPASREQCLGIERAAVWSWVHLQERLQAHIAGQPSKWASSLLP